MPKRTARHNLPLRRNTMFHSASQFSRRVGSGLTLAVSLAGCFNTAVAAEPADYMDWVPREQLPPEERAELAPFCRGAFREPDIDHDEANLDPRLAPIRLEADRTSVTNGSRIELEGDVQITQGARLLRAEVIRYNHDTEEASLVGSVIIRQPGTLIRGEEAHVNMGGNEAEFDEARFLLHGQHLRGGADKIEQTENRVIILTNGRVTTCEPVEESWVLEGGRLRIDPDKGQGSGRNVVLRFGGVPVLYVPYIRFPIGDERQSGFLFPVVSYSQTDGLDLAIPYYFNLAPNYDLILTPRIISERGAMLEADGRHLSPLFETRVNLAYLGNDRSGTDPDYEELIDSGQVTREELQPYAGEDRWLARLDQAGGRNRPWYSRIDYNAVSDIDYFRDLDTASFSIANSTYLNQSAEFGYLFPNWSMRARLQDYQTLLSGLEDTYRQLPRLDLDGGYHWGQFHLQLDNEYAYFDHSQNTWANDAPVITGQRLRSSYRLAWDHQQQWGHLRPHVGLQHLRYQLDRDALLPQDPNDPSLTAGEAGLDLGLVFDRYGLDGSLEQTLEPRLFYLYREHVDHSALTGLTARNQVVNFDTTTLNFNYSQLFRDNRFSGGDRIDDANHIVAGLTSRWYANDQREWLTASIGQIYYLDDRQVTLSGRPETEARSELATQLSSAITQNLNVRADVLFDDSARAVHRASVFGHYGDDTKLFNLGYRYINPEAVGATSEDDVTQLDFSFSNSLTSQWQAVGRANYDISAGRELEVFGGFEYNDCCYRLRVLARRWLDSKIADLITDRSLEYDQGIFFEIQLKGLGGTGDRVRTILEDSIVGYRERQLHFNN